MTDAAADVPAAMDAWRQTRYGGPEVVRMERMPVPVPGATDVLLRVRATSVNSGDVKVMRGVPLLIRPASGLRHPRLATRGIDVAGTVASIGSEVTAFAVGDEAMGEIAGGALAEFVVAPATLLTRRPDGLSAADAATLPVAGGTAWQALDSAGVTRGDRVLVIGASGGVGHFAVQLAAQRAAEVWALCGARSARMVGDLGAVRTFDYRTTDAADLPHASFDAVVDIAGSFPLRALRRLVRPSGTLVLVSGEGGRVGGPIGRILRGILLSLTPGPRIRPVAAVPKPDVTRELAALAATGGIRPVVERTFAFDEARAALAHVDAGHTVGKVVVDVP
ncbi:MAG TPA: NAD(P)-dependent alcohol dehydrogenase [Microbacterium sp.]|nr:NAD(P)-dependent alcohol dehydrogenase [Microbacterium sp.]